MTLEQLSLTFHLRQHQEAQATRNQIDTRPSATAMAML